MQNAKDFTKLKQLSWTERWTDGRTERQSDEQTDRLISGRVPGVIT